MPASSANWRAHEDVVDVVLDQHRERRRREVQQEDEEQRPEHRLARLRHRRASCSSASGCAAARRCRTSGRTRARGSCGARCRAPARPCPGTARHAGAAAPRRAARPASSPSTPPSPCPDPSGMSVERLLGCDFCTWPARWPPWPRRAASRSAARRRRTPWRGPSAPRSPRRRAALKILRTSTLLRIGGDLLLERRRPSAAPGRRRPAASGMPVCFIDEPDHRGQVGDDQDDVLRHLRPRDRAHAAEERADQDAAQADEHADLELEPGEARW